jgi:protocatechuate 3,4-dioxygenase beta subunit
MKKNILFILAILLAIGITYLFTPRPYQVHWHGNFAVYIDGKQEDFSSDMYMEETARCNVTTDVQPQDRIHLHDKK